MSKKVEAIEKQIAADKKVVADYEKSLEPIKKQEADLKKKIADAKETVTKYQKELAPVQEKRTSIEKKITTLKKSISTNSSMMEELKVRAADTKTQAVKLGKQCQQGSHESIATIKKAHKNCTACRTEDVKDGACDRKKGAHKHYYCFCDC